MSLAAQPLRLIRATTLAAAVSDQTTIGGYTLVFDETTKQLAILAAGVATKLSGAAIAPTAGAIAFPDLTDSPASQDALRDDLQANWKPQLVAMRTALINAGLITGA